MKKSILVLGCLMLMLVFSSCSSNSSDDLADGDVDKETTETEVEAEQDIEITEEIDQETKESTEKEAWEFDRNNYEPIHGWILLDSNPDAVKNSIEQAAKYNVNHIQLSHGLIMDIDELLGDTESVKTKVDTLNIGIKLAHENKMKAYVWAHELEGTGLDICYDPDDPVWQTRRDAYKKAIAKIPDVDGVILMFGSANMPPWFTMCTCDWCEENYDGVLFDIPPIKEKIKMVVERIGGYITNDLKKELFIRTFVHEPSEIAYHSEGLALSEGVEFTGMHKGPVQDWQPYNPHHACIGNIGNHPSMLELDIAGEYYGKSELPFCAPGYYRYRMNHAFANKGIGAVIRIQRGSASALGTPNEVNIYAVNKFANEPDATLSGVWKEFIESFYGLKSDNPSQKTLQEILELTFPIRLKSHYVLGIWALNKNSSLPNDIKLDQFTDRGEMPKWDANWSDRWNDLREPDFETLLNIWQEGNEAIELAEKSLELFETIKNDLKEADRADLEKRLLHQKFAARAWRDMKLFIWASSGRLKTDQEDTIKAWKKWLHEDLAQIILELDQAKLTGLTIANQNEIQTFIDNTSKSVPQDVTAQEPEKWISPISIKSIKDGKAELSFTLYKDANVKIEYGKELPNFKNSIDQGYQKANKEISVTLTDLEPNSRYVVRVRTDNDKHRVYGGDFWIFTE